mgnify:CR=1 FL=1
MDLEEKLESLDNEMAANATNSKRLSELAASGNRPKQIWNIKWSVWEYLEELAEKSMHRMRISIVIGVESRCKL